MDLNLSELPPGGVRVVTTIEPIRPVRASGRFRWQIGVVRKRPTPPHSPSATGRPARRYHPYLGDAMLLRDDQQVTLSVSPVDQAGNAVPVDSIGPITFSVDDNSVLTLTDNGDGTALVVTTGTLGTAVITAANDHDDDGTIDYQGSLAFDVVNGEVAGISVTAGEPTSRF
jgi:hypothetical protein